MIYYKILNGKIIITWEGHARKEIGSISGEKGLRKITKISCHYTQSLDQDLNLGSPIYKAKQEC